MQGSMKTQLTTLVLAGLAMLPWLAAMYGFYWLETSGTWNAETPHRGKLSVMILGSGMAASFIVWTLLGKLDKRRQS